MEGIQIFGFVSGIVTSSGMIPQLIKTWKTKEVEELSIKMFIIYLIGFLMWITYGIIQKDIPIVATNILSVIITIIMIFLKIKYQHKRQ